MSEDFDIEAALGGPAAAALAEAFQAAGRQAPSPGEVVVERLKEGAGNPTSVGVWRVTAGEHSVVVKVVTLPDETVLPHDVPEALNYWRREIEVFESDATRGLPVPLVSVEYYGAAEIEPGTAALFLEDLGSIERADWSLDWYRSAVEGFARWQAPYLVGRPLPTDWWLNHDVSRRWHALTRTYWGDFMSLALAGDPRLARFTPAGCDPDFRALIEIIVDPEPLLRALDVQPHVLCHNDANIDNLLVRNSDESESHIVLFDLQWFGTAGVGTELGQLLCQIPAELEGRSRQDIDAEMLDLYFDAVGARDAGITRDHIEFNYSASAALRQFCFAMALESFDIQELLDPGREEELEEHLDTFFDNKRGGPLPRLAARAYELIPHVM